MDKIKAILHGTTVEEEREKKEEKKEEKKLEKEGHSGEGSHLGSSTHNTTSHTSNVNPTPEGIAGTTGGLGHNTMKSDYNSTPHDSNLTTHDRHAEREANIGAGGVDLPHRPRDSEHTTGHTSGLGGVGNGSNITGPNTQVHGINSATGTSEAGLASQEARGPLSSHAVGNTESHHGRDAALGSGAALTAAQIAHSHGEHRNTHDNQGLGSGTTGTNQTHHGRDAALGTGAAAGAAGLAHHEHGQHHTTHDNQGLGSGVSGTHQLHLGRDAALGTGAAAGLAHHEHGQHNTHDNQGLGSGVSGTHQSHLGRDAALGTGAAAGLAHHEHGQHQATHGLGGGVGGPHTTATANLLDPKVNPTGPTETAHKHHGHGGRVEGGGAEEADGDHGHLGTSAGTGILGKSEYEAGHHTGSTTAGPHSSNLANKADPRVDSDLSKSQGHHYGRDAAVAGGLGAAGASAYGAGHHDNTTAGPHSSNLGNKADPRVDSDLSRSQDHHYGRDAALAGGVGAAGLGAHEAGHSTHQNPNTLSSGTTGYGNTTAGPHSSNLANKADPRVDSDRSKDHHYGRDAAVAGGVGAAGYEANKHLGHNDSTTHSNTTAGPHDSNLANKADPRVDSDRSKDHHYGRDAALAGGAGGAAYEANKHLGHNNNTHTTHGPTTTTTTTSTAGPHDSNLANKADPRVDSDRSKDHHYGRDAALAGGAGGAAYEANKHLGHDNNTHLNKTPLDQKPPGKDLGDHLHGVERNRGVPGDTGFPHSEGHHHGSTSSGTTRDPAVGTGVPGAPRGNVLKGEHTHHHGQEADVHHNNHGMAGPEHLITAPVMNDPDANHDLVGAEHGHTTGHAV
ncbi:cell surface protein [Rutstroemia sp. NJR-2017a BBW]|nr:cell surface protein [Rutstroemia sp. NJR-2017a BBW]